MIKNHGRPHPGARGFVRAGIATVEANAVSGEFVARPAWKLGGR